MRILKDVGIYAHSLLTVERQELAMHYVIRGLDSAGSVEDVGRYVTFAAEVGEPLESLHPIETIAVNGLHAVVTSNAKLRADMLRKGRTCELLITRHCLNLVTDGAKPWLECEIVFRGIHGRLEARLRSGSELSRCMSHGSHRRWRKFAAFHSHAAILVLCWCTTGAGWLLSDSNTGWHILTVEWILRNWRIPSTDLFSFTRTGQTWFAWEWLSGVSMAVAHSHIGLGGVVLLSLLVLPVSSLCVYKNTVEETEHRLIAISLTGLAIAASTIHWLARPHLVTPLFAAVFCSVFNRVEKRAIGERFLLLLPALTILWVNLHGGFFVGIILLMTHGLGSAAEGAHLALYSVRNIPIFAPVSAPGIGLAMRDWFQFARARWSLDWRGKLAASLDELETGLRVIAGNRNRRPWHLAPGLTMLVLALLLSHSGRMKALHADFDPSAFPTDAAAFLSRNEPAPRFRLYASWQRSGYLIYRLWPSIRVFEDGRTDFDGLRFVEQGFRVGGASRLGRGPNPESNECCSRSG